MYHAFPSKGWWAVGMAGTILVMVNSAISLRECSAKPGTDLVHGDTANYAKPGTDMIYDATSSSSWEA